MDWIGNERRKRESRMTPETLWTGVDVHEDGKRCRKSWLAMTPGAGETKSCIWMC